MEHHQESAGEHTVKQMLVETLSTVACNEGRRCRLVTNRVVIPTLHYKTAAWMPRLWLSVLTVYYEQGLTVMRVA